MMLSRGLFLHRSATTTTTKQYRVRQLLEGQRRNLSSSGKGNPLQLSKSDEGKIPVPPVYAFGVALLPVGICLAYYQLYRPSDEELESILTENYGKEIEEIKRRQQPFEDILKQAIGIEGVKEASALEERLDSIRRGEIQPKRRGEENVKLTDFGSGADDNDNEDNIDDGMMFKTNVKTKPLGFDERGNPILYKKHTRKRKKKKKNKKPEEELPPSPKDTEVTSRTAEKDSALDTTITAVCALAAIATAVVVVGSVFGGSGSGSRR